MLPKTPPTTQQFHTVHMAWPHKGNGKKAWDPNSASFGVLTIAQTFFFWGEKGTQFKKRYLYRYRHVKKCLCWLLAYQHWHFVESTFPTSIQDWHDLSVSWSSYDMLKNVDVDYWHINIGILLKTLVLLVHLFRTGAGLASLHPTTWRMVSGEYLP